MQIQYNITRIEEWCKSHDMPEGTLQLEHLMQATKLLQLKKATPADIEIIYDVCWMLSPMQIQRMCISYYVADYEARPRSINSQSHTHAFVESHLTRDLAHCCLARRRKRPQRPPTAPRSRGGGTIRAPAPA